MHLPSSYTSCRGATLTFLSQHALPMLGVQVSAQIAHMKSHNITGINFDLEQPLKVRQAPM